MPLRPALLLSLLSLSAGAHPGIRVTAWPPSTQVSVTLADGSTKKGRVPLILQEAAGKVRVEYAAPGHRPVSREYEVTRGGQELQACLDPVDQVMRCLRHVSTGGGPKGVWLTPEGREAWVTNLVGPKSLRHVDLQTGETLGIVTNGKKGGAVEVRPSADGKTLYATQMDTGIIFETDPRTHTVLRAMDGKGVMPKWIQLSRSGKELFVSNWATNDISELDLVQGKLKRKLTTVKTPRGMYPSKDGKFLYAAGFGSGELAKIDLATGKTTVLFKGGALRHMTADDARDRLYISDMGRAAIYVVDLKTDTVKPLCKTQSHPNTIEVSPDGKLLFVSNRGRNNAKSYYVPGPEYGTVMVFDALSGDMLDVIVGGNQPTALDLSDDGKVLAFSDFLDGRLRVYAVPTYEELKAGAGGRSKSYLKDLGRVEAEVPPGKELKVIPGVTP